MTARVFPMRSRSAQSQSLGKPAARYPAAIATDSDLTIAVDRQQTALALALDNASTLMTVSDPSSISAYNLLSIDLEIVKVTGPPSGDVVPVSRGFDGTTPAIHLPGALVSGFVDAWHHNALTAEVEAIEQTLGVHLANVPTSPFILPAAFAPQTPGGSLVVGNNAITLSPVPLGVNGFATDHYLWVSGGTGAAEACLITGGSALSGAASGQLIIQCANAHSGAWTIQTATAGIQEAVKLATPNYGIYIPAGTYLLNATVTLFNNSDVEGAGSPTVLVPGSASMVMMQTPAAGNSTHIHIRNLMFDGTSLNPVNTVIAIKEYNSYYSQLKSLIFRNIGTAVYLDYCVTVQASDWILMDNTTVWVGSTSDATGKYTFQFQAVNIYHMTTGSTLTFPRAALVTFERAINCTMTGLTTQGLKGLYNAIDILNDCQGVVILGGCLVAPIIGVNFASTNLGAGLRYPGYSQIVGVGVDQYTQWGIHFDSGSFYNSVLGGVVGGATAATCIAGIGFADATYGNTVEGVTIGAGTTQGQGVVVQPTALDATILDNYFAMGAASGSADIEIDPSVGTVNLRIIGNQRSATDGAGFMLVNNATGGRWAIHDNGTIDDVMGVDIVSGASITPTNAVTRVSGNAAISTIVRSNLSVGAIYTGPVTLIPTGAWTLVTGGNIAAASAAAIGKAMTLTWDSTAQKWVPSY
jgi:hypothetical protein